jgi:hypothetical protein
MNISRIISRRICFSKFLQYNAQSVNRRNFFTQMSELPTAEMSEMVLGEDGKPLTKSALKKLEKQREKERKKAEVAARLVFQFHFRLQKKLPEKLLILIVLPKDTLNC